MASPADRYRLAGSIYDLCTATWSGGAIWRSRRALVEAFAGGERVLFPGGGTGRAAVLAAQHGARVTLVDRSPTMLAAARKRADRAGVEVEIVEGDVRDHAPMAVYDSICASHFLNVFPANEMRAVRALLLGLLRPGGRLCIADFAPPSGARLSRALQSIHHVLPLGGCALLTTNAMHPIYDHGAELAAQGIAPESISDFRVYGVGPRWYRSWTFVRP